MKIFRIFITFTILLFNICVFADNIQMNSSVDRTVVPLDEAFQLTISISGDTQKLPDFSAPTFADFNVFSTSQSKSMSFVNGQYTNTVNYIYTLGPKKTGEFTIPSFKLTYNGNTYETDPVKVKVEQAQAKNSVSVQNTQIPQYKQSSEVYNFDTSKAVFVKSTTDKKQVYVNEKVVYTFSFYTSVNLLSNPSYQAPDFAGFFTGSTTQNSYRTRINNKDYVVNEVATELFPQKDGLLTIGSSKILVSIEDFSKNYDDFFSSFFRRSKNVELTTDPLNIKVLKIPANAEMVGKFNISASVSGKTVKEDDPFELKITIKGSGNAKTVKEPEIVLSENLRKYETSEKIIKEGDKETGKEFTVLIMPESAGEAEIRIVPLTYFDTVTKELKKLTAKNIKINISENPDKKRYEQQQMQQTLDNVQEKQNLNQITLPQNIDLSVMVKIYNFIISAKFWISVLIIAVLGILIKLFFVYKRYAGKDQQKLKNKKAYKKSKKYFKKARQSKNSSEFYEYMYKGILEYFSSVLAQPADGLTAYKIRKELEERNIDKNIIEQTERILEDCTIVLYAKGQVSENGKDFSDFYNRAFDTLKKIDI